jgi:DNA-binding HxlR family transcriptional regulator
VEYKLTARGAALRPVLIALQQWSNTQKLEVRLPDPIKAIIRDMKYSANSLV